MSKQTEDFGLFDDLFDNFEVELLELISEMSEEERIILTHSQDLPQCISDVLKNHVSDSDEVIAA